MPGMTARTGATAMTPAPAQWQNGKFVPQAGAENDADQLSKMRADEANATRAGQQYAGKYTDSQGRVTNVNSPAQAPAFSQKMDDFSTLMSRFGNMGGTSNFSSRGGLGNEPRVSLDTNAIDAGDRAAFSQAKDKVGGATQGLMKSLSNQFASRGLRGSSMEGRAIGSGLEAGMGQLDDVARGQAVEGSRRALDVAKTQYGGDITQRGQDIDAETADRQIDASTQSGKLASVLGLFNAFNGMKY